MLKLIHYLDVRIMVLICQLILHYQMLKIQSNFTFSMASTGDPSTFTFTMDAMPGYTYLLKQRKFFVIQVN